MHRLQKINVKRLVATALCVGMLAECGTPLVGVFTPPIQAQAAVTESQRTAIESCLYNAEYYEKANDDVAVALKHDDEAMYQHWLNYGMAEGRNASMVFNAKYYLEKNPDVAAEVGEDYVAAYEHFVTTGLLEGRESSPVFSVKYYLEANTDVAQAFNGDYVSAAKHFNENAIAEGRSGSGNFDYTVYRSCNKDVEELYGEYIEGYYIHYINHGRAEGRTGGLAADSTGNENNSEKEEYVFDGKSGIEVLDALYAVDGWVNETFYEGKAKECAQEAYRILELIIDEDMTEYEKVLAIHDYIVLHTHVLDIGDEEVADELFMYTYNESGPLLQGIGQQQSYESVTWLLLSAAGVAVKSVNGYITQSDGSHFPVKWNLVQVDGEWYHLWIMFDDGSRFVANDYQLLGCEEYVYDPYEIGYRYFLISDEDMWGYYKWNKEDYPATPDKRYEADLEHIAYVYNGKGEEVYFLEMNEQGSVFYEADFLSPKDISIAKRLFNVDYYLEKYPDLEKIYGRDEEKLFEFWRIRGLMLGQVISPVLEPSEYLWLNADVGEVVKYDHPHAIVHFLDYGIFEGRSGSFEFDYTVYKDCNTDVADVFDDDIVGYYAHYTKDGYSEGRTAALSKTEMPETIGWTLVYPEGNKWQRLYHGEQVRFHFYRHPARETEFMVDCYRYNDDGTVRWRIQDVFYDVDEDEWFTTYGKNREAYNMANQQFCQMRWLYHENGRLQEFHISTEAERLYYICYNVIREDGVVPIGINYMEEGITKDEYYDERGVLSHYWEYDYEYNEEGLKTRATTDYYERIDGDLLNLTRYEQVWDTPGSYSSSTDTAYEDYDKDGKFDICIVTRYEDSKAMERWSTGDEFQSHALYEYYDNGKKKKYTVYIMQDGKEYLGSLEEYEENGKIKHEELYQHAYTTDGKPDYTSIAYYYISDYINGRLYKQAYYRAETNTIVTYEFEYDEEGNQVVKNKTETKVEAE